MIPPELPHNEQERLQSLRSLNILDTEPEERFDRLTRIARRLFAVESALVSLVDEKRQWFKSRQGCDFCQTDRSISFCGHAILGDDIFVIEDARQDPRFQDNPMVLGPPHVRFYAGCPLSHLNGHKLGTLCILDSQPRTMSEQDVRLLKDLAQLAQGELAGLQLATMDELTQISNRRGFEAIAKNSMSLCVRQKLWVSLVFLDLNKFKPINDTFGHGEGDLALKAFAQEMIACFRNADVCARIGGDEFAVLLSNCNEEQAQASIARFRLAVERYNQQANRGYDLLFSHGIVSKLPDDSLTIEHLLSEADALMYAMKKRQSSSR